MLNYSLNPRGIACEHFDDETIILNLPKGNYYSLKGSGQFIWTCLEKGLNSADIALSLSAFYDIPVGESQQALDPFLEQLSQEELIVSVSNQAPGDSQVTISNKAELPFIKPFLEVYSDMQELLMLDPIHDADPGQGWPNQANA